MIPQWQIALVQAINTLKAGGELWIVDFGQLDRAPAICKLLLFKWLALFSVHPQPQLEDVMRTLAAHHQLDIEVSKPYKGYVLIIRAIKQP
jgi:S-adenosylmethionine-diacylgycerolhomoserine-N-methlytransferase